MVLTVNEPFESKQKAIEEGSDIKSEIILQEHVEKRKRVFDTDNGKKLQNEIKRHLDDEKYMRQYHLQQQQDMPDSKLFSIIDNYVEVISIILLTFVLVFLRTYV